MFKIRERPRKDRKAPGASIKGTKKEKGQVDKIGKDATDSREWASQSRL